MTSAFAALAAAAFVGGYALGARSADPELAGRQALVAERGAQVMPFDLDRTTHVFAKRPDGGVQTVVADDSGDAAQVASVRRHLREEAAKFRRGEFDDPAAIHGMEMPGLAELRAGYERVVIRYDEVPGGGQIRYRSDDSALVRALHDWFEAQLMDHGVDARSGSGVEDG